MPPERGRGGRRERESERESASRVWGTNTATLGHGEAQSGCRFRSLTLATWTRVHANQCSVAPGDATPTGARALSLIWLRVVFHHSSLRSRLPLFAASDSPGNILHLGNPDI